MIRTKVTELPIVKGINEIRKMTEKDFLESDYRTKDNISLSNFEKMKNSKEGEIWIQKVSNNPGYLSGGEERHGFVPLFAEGFSCHVIVDDIYEGYYYTSNIVSIDWNKSEFYTLNSTYKFKLNEMTAQEYDKKERT